MEKVDEKMKRSVPRYLVDGARVDLVLENDAHLLSLQLSDC